MESYGIFKLFLAEKPFYFRKDLGRKLSYVVDDFSKEIADLMQVAVFCIQGTLFLDKEDEVSGSGKLVESLIDVNLCGSIELKVDG